MSNLPKITKAQLQTLNNPLRLEILTSLRVNGPSTVGEIGARLGRDERLLYYHLKTLAKVGLVFVSGAKPTATKPETVFTARPPGVADDLDLTDPDTRLQMQRNVNAVLKAAGKEYGKALDAMENDSYEFCQLVRLTASLLPENRDELRKRVRELAEWLADRNEPDGVKYSFTLAVSPLQVLGREAQTVD